MQLFFMISAFTLLSADKAGPVRAFCIRRFFRIAPLYYLGIVGYLLLHGMGPQFYAPHGVSGADVALNVLFLHGWEPVAAFAVVPGGWSIGCEAMFYLAFPWARSRIGTMLRSAVFVGLTVGASVAATVAISRVLHDPAGHSWSYLNPVSQAPSFALGILAFHCCQRLSGNALAQRLAGYGIFFALVGLAALAVASTTLTRFHLIADIPLFALLVSVVLSAPGWLVNSVTAWIGRISYSIYIVHFALIDLIRPLCAHSPIMRELAFVIVLGASITVAHLMHTVIEQPMIRLGRKLSADRPAGR